MELVTYGPEETFSLGEKIGRYIVPGSILALSGDLGVGKTALSQGIAKGLGITEQVVSPTFVLIQEYEGGRLPLYHMDMYRLKTEREFAQLGLEDYFNSNGVMVIEWAERLGGLLPADHIAIHIQAVSDTERKLTVSYDESKFIKQPLWLREVFADEIIGH
ncbi:MAG: tRNA (adenosine(37)-N6)-threonylcarbamoyltransferase complex ATPase subunit type 1 TsaE [Peptococcaceae bacterium]|nr:tRNA (adenosine(37)-N6)-threonylcarbamoyltransferase complex ATPase subunit type 1 TsaE [Peptococcaceae bacterium]